MKRPYKYLISAISAITFAGLALTAQASASTAQPGHAGSVSGVGRVVTLSPQACSALRQKLHNPKASCAAEEHTVVSRITDPAPSEPHIAPPASGTTYYSAYSEWCGWVSSNGGYCSGWDFILEFNFTASATNVWINGTPDCQPYNVTMTWCGDADNGKPSLSVGGNFNGDAYPRLNVNAENAPNGDAVYLTTQCGPSWCVLAGGYPYDCNESSGVCS
jgi:hypothetical protein